MKTTIILPALVLLGACKENHTLGTVARDAAFYPQGSGDDATQSIEPDSRTPSPAADLQPLGPLGPVESWTGWVENYAFESGSDAITFSFASDPDGRIAGQVVLGSGTPPPPATDPNSGYPDDQAKGPTTIEGFPYTMFEGSITSNRIRFTFRPWEPWAGWCALQTPPSDVNSGNTRCLREGNGLLDPTNDLCLLYPSDQKFDAPVKVDCGVFFLCQSAVCFCSPAGCRLRVPEDVAIPSSRDYVPMVSFDMAYSGNLATGSMGSQSVHFTKDP